MTIGVPIAQVLLHDLSSESFPLECTISLISAFLLACTWQLLALVEQQRHGWQVSTVLKLHVTFLDLTIFCSSSIWEALSQA